VTNEEDCKFIDCSSSDELRILPLLCYGFESDLSFPLLLKSFVITKISSLSMMILRWNCEGELDDDDSSLEFLKASSSFS
jgi:hypothetical protein